VQAVGDGTYVDKQGQPVSTSIDFQDYECQCFDEVVVIPVYDSHSNKVLQKDTSIRVCDYTAVKHHFANGFMEINCAGSIQSKQSVWFEMYNCGAGMLHREFEFWNSCSSGKGTDTLRRYQLILISNSCPLEPGFIQAPPDLELGGCRPTLDPNGSGNIGGEFHPDSTGWPSLQSEEICGQYGYSYHDDIFDFFDGHQLCFLIKRNWYVGTWCEVHEDDGWWENPNEVVGFFVQYIIVRDTLLPTSTHSFAGSTNDTIRSSNCSTDVTVEVDLEDNCGLQSFSFTLEKLLPSGHIPWDAGLFQLDGANEDSLSLLFSNLEEGSYKLRLRTIDNCNNEAFLTDTFTFVSTLKPSANCRTILSAELDENGMSRVNAEDFIVSASPSCGDTSVLILVDTGGLDYDSYIDDSESILLNCDDKGLNLIRVWYIGLPSGRADFCEVLLNVQEHQGCPTSSVAPSDPDSLRPIETVLLHQNYPNPFTGKTTIDFYLPEDTDADITIYTVEGELVKTFGSFYPRGNHSITIDTKDLKKRGVLFYQLETPDHTVSRRMIIIN